MKAHIRKVPTKETYVSKVGEVLGGLAAKTDIPSDVLGRLSMKLESDEYFNKMKEAFGYEAEKETGIDSD